MTYSLRIIKIGLTTSIALFFTLVTLNNILDFDSDWFFVKHVLSMDTTFKHSTIMWRAITSPTIQLACYYLIIVWEAITALLCWIGSFILLINLKTTDFQFNQSKKWALIGLFLGFLLYMVGFIIIGGEWFCMWQSTVSNGQTTAGLFTSLIMFVMIVLMFQEL
ncbi:MAG: DUF2165 domain-containing protein [Legionellaceae bacterium]|nr:DUF2165 domain-containing protein [Legionellaceae bacterium]